LIKSDQEEMERKLKKLVFRLEITMKITKITMRIDTSLIKMMKTLGKRISMLTF